MRKKYILLFISISMLSGLVFAQENSAGKCYSNDYHLWNDNGQPDLYGDCGTSDIFNTGNEITLEVWVRAYGYGENRKIMGKKAFPDLSTNGYVLGYENLNLYTEISNPYVQEVPRPGTGPMPADSAWIHLVSTFNANGQMVNYINGENVGQIDIFPPNPISPSDGPFIIGRAPWDYAYLFYGDLDEVRVWNVQRTEEQINDAMFKQLTGNETGLVAYYNFNQPADSIFYDQTTNGNDGVLKKYGHVAFDWASSFAPVGDSKMYDMHNVSAAWYGKEATGYNRIDTLQGLSFITNIGEKEFKNYLIAGHNNALGTTQDSIPETAPVDFKRLKRSWYVNQAGEFETDLVFDLKKCAADGDTLETYQADSLYTLLKLDEATAKYEPVYSASVAYFDADNYNLVFNSVDLSDGYYTVGHCSERLAYAYSINEIETSNSEINIYPNPAKDDLTITNSKDGKVEIYNTSGSKVYESVIRASSETLNIEGIKRGVYVIQVTTNHTIKTTKIIIQ